MVHSGICLSVRVTVGYVLKNLVEDGEAKILDLAFSAIGACHSNTKNISWSRKLGERAVFLNSKVLQQWNRLTRGSNVEDAGVPLAADLVVGETQDGAVVCRRGGREGEHGARPVRDEVGSGRKKLFGRRRRRRRRRRGGGRVEVPVEFEIRRVSHDVAHQNDRV